MFNNYSFVIPKVTDRIQKLKDFELTLSREIDIDRLRYLTRGYEKYTELPMILRRAYALKEVMENMTIFIEDDQLLVGSVAGKPMAAALYPEYSFEWLGKEIDEIPLRKGDKFLVSEEVKSEILSHSDFWKGRTVYDRCQALLPADVQACYAAGLLSATGNMTSGDGHTLVDYEMVVNHGLKAVIKQTEEKITSLDLTSGADVHSLSFLNAVLVICNAAISFAHRYSDLALVMAKSESSDKRRTELEMIAETCLRVPEYPAETFNEAVQSVWFIHMLIHLESNGHSWSLGRFDQYMNPFLERDLAGKRINEDFARELICCLWLKMFSIPKLRPWVHTQMSAGNPTYQNVTIGGLKPDGSDGTNHMTFLVLDSIAETQLTQPNLSARWCKDSPKKYMERCAEVISLGFGMPALHNDDLMIPSLMMQGVSEIDARNYAIIGCIEPIIPGKWGYRAAGMSFTNFAKILEITINDGKDPLTGKQVGLQTGNLEDLKDWSELWSAWKKQLEYVVKMRVKGDTVIDLVIEDLVPDALCSSLIADCIGRGKHLKEGGAVYDMVCGPETGLADTANSFAAIKKFIFEDKSIAPKDLIDALKTNFESKANESLRLKLFNRAPKYGNDIDGVDKIASEVFTTYSYELDKYHNTRYKRGPIGCHYFPCTATISGNVPMGKKVGALPFGRKAYEPLAEGISPSQGTDRSGPTAVLKSVAQLPNLLITGGNLLNQRLSPGILSTKEGIDRLIDLVRGFFELGGWHVQYNVISSEILREAQKHPEQYLGLVVRVAGYSARFIELAPDVQDDIIARTEHTL